MKLVMTLIVICTFANVFALENTVVNIVHSENPKIGGWSENVYWQNRSSFSDVLTEYYYSKKLNFWLGEGFGSPNSWGSRECLSFKQKQELNNFITDLKILKNRIETPAVQLNYTLDSICK